jgi:hypothetical protein
MNTFSSVNPFSQSENSLQTLYCISISLYSPYAPNGCMSPFFIIETAHPSIRLILLFLLRCFTHFSLCNITLKTISASNAWKLVTFTFPTDYKAFVLKQHFYQTFNCFSVIPIEKCETIKHYCNQILELLHKEGLFFHFYPKK